MARAMMTTPRKPSHSASAHMISRARALRSNATHEERVLWYRLRLLRAQGYHFRRQAPFDRYVLDFVCHKQRVVVELDGSQHGLPEQAKRDAVRDRLLAGKGYRTVRIANYRVRDNPEYLAEYIQQELQSANRQKGETTQ